MAPALTAIPVVWATYHPDAPHRGFWDQAMLEDLFAGRLWRTVDAVAFEHHDTVDAVAGRGAAVVVAGGANADHLDRLERDLNRLPWVLLFVTSDEEGLCGWRNIRHPRMLVWVQYPRGDLGDARWWPLGYAPGAPAILAAWPPPEPRPLIWAFEGQVTTDIRRACVAALEQVDGGLAYPTEGFAQGAPYHDYLQLLASTVVAPAPAGHVHPDSFRLWEALEAGAVPITDTPGHWADMLGEAPWPVVDDWDQAPDRIAAAVKVPSLPPRMSSWWQQHKRRLAYQVHDDIRALAEQPTGPRAVADLVTVVMPTSPIPSHPDTTVIEETLASIRAQPPLAGCEVLVMCDGIRLEQDHYRERYAEYLARLAWLCEHRWERVLPIVHGEHQHQARMTRHALGLVRTPLVLFVEHDTPLADDIDWAGLTRVFADHPNDVALVRFHHEAGILEPHQHLMVDTKPRHLAGVPLLRTVQWSQRPHLAQVGYYRRILDDHFEPDERWMIEDRMHSVVQSEGWADHRLWMYAPPGDMKRSTHLDGRAGDPKWTDR